jgi:hypothetical protein
MNLKPALYGLLLWALINSQGWFALLLCPHCSGRLVASASEMNLPEGSNEHACCTPMAPTLPRVSLSGFDCTGCSLSGCLYRWSSGPEPEIGWRKGRQPNPLKGAVTVGSLRVLRLGAFTIRGRAESRAGPPPSGGTLYLFNVTLLI